jgi:hypothetical protein
MAAERQKWFVAAIAPVSVLRVEEPVSASELASGGS